MKFADADHLGFIDLADAWSSEPGTRSYDFVLDRLLKAYWLGEFESVLPATPSDWPQRQATATALRFCKGFPPEGLPELDEGEFNWQGLSQVKLSDFPIPGQAVLGAVDLPRKMIELWCLDKGIELPSFWFPEEESEVFPGRPSIKRRILAHLTLRHERGETEPTLAAEARKLHSWANKEFTSSHQIPGDRSIENIVRGKYWALKNQDSNG